MKFLVAWTLFCIAVVVGISVYAAQAKIDQQRSDLQNYARREAIIIQQREALRAELEQVRNENRQLRRELDILKGTR